MNREEPLETARKPGRNERPLELARNMREEAANHGMSVHRGRTLEIAGWEAARNQGGGDACGN